MGQSAEALLASGEKSIKEVKLCGKSDIHACLYQISKHCPDQQLITISLCFHLTLPGVIPFLNRCTPVFVITLGHTMHLVLR